MRTLVTFEANCLDDSLWDDDDNLRVPGGRILAEKLLNKLNGNGFVSSTVLQHSFYGWTFDVGRGKASVQFVLQGGCPWILVADKLHAQQAATTDGISLARIVLLEVDRVLQSESMFSEVRWFNRQDYELGHFNCAASSPF